MKNMLKLISISAILLIYSCRHRGGMEVTYSENDHFYSMTAVYDPARTHSVERYMDERIGHQNNMSFMNTRIDGTLALDDHTAFYIKKHAGFLEIKLDKDKNSPESYEEIKSLCEGISSRVN